MSVRPPSRASSLPQGFRIASRASVELLLQVLDLALQGGDVALDFLDDLMDVAIEDRHRTVFAQYGDGLIANQRELTNAVSHELRTPIPSKRTGFPPRLKA